MELLFKDKEDLVNKKHSHVVQSRLVWRWLHTLALYKQMPQSPAVVMWPLPLLREFI